MPARPLRKPLLTPAARVVAVRGRPAKRQPLASRTTAPSTMPEIAQRIGSGATLGQHEIADGNAHDGGDQQQADAAPVDQPHDAGQQRQGDDDLQQQAERHPDRPARTARKTPES